MPFTAWYRALISLTSVVGIVLLILHRGDLSVFVTFTVQSNIVLAVVYGLAAAGRAAVRLRGAATLYIAITGTVYHLVLANPASPFHTPGAGTGSPTVHNILLHTVAPLLAALDWVLLNREAVRWWYAVLWLAYPLAYLVFALVRGALVHRYPYPFVDAGKLGYGGVTVSALVFTVLFFLLGLALIGIGALARRGLATAGAVSR